MKGRRWLAIGSLGGLGACASAGQDVAQNQAAQPVTAASSEQPSSVGSDAPAGGSAAVAMTSASTTTASAPPAPGAPGNEIVTFNPEGLTFDQARKIVTYDLDARTRKAGHRLCFFNHDHYLAMVGKRDEPVTIEVKLVPRDAEPGSQQPRHHDCTIVRVIGPLK